MEFNYIAHYINNVYCMSLFQVKEKPKDYDVCIVGSGAGGGMAAYQLSKAGLKIALIEAGGHFDPKDPQHVTQLKWPYESPRRGADTNRPFGDFDAAWGGWNLNGEPYTKKNGTEFKWFRSRMVGGRTNHWGRISLRFGQKDFKHKSIDGLGEDWPIDYDDVAPYYDKVDKLIGVFGTNEGLEDHPDGYFLPPPKPRLHELFIKEAGKKTGVKVMPSRMSMLTRPINEDRGVCFYCGQCDRSCQVYADFSSSSVLVKPAVNRGNVDVYTNAMVRKILTDEEGETTGVSYVDTEDMQEYEIRGKTVVLAASSCESARLLLNSKSKQHPNGLANSSNVVGKYLHDSTGASRGGIIPELFGRKRYNEDGVGGMHVYSPWWLDNKDLDFPRGYHIEYSGGMGMPGYGFGWGIEDMNGTYADRHGNKKEGGGYGIALKDDYRYFYGAGIGLAGRGECIAREDNYCEIDPEKVDKYGIPVLRFNYSWSDYEVKQAEHMQDTFEEMLNAMGAVPIGDKPGPESNYGLLKAGEVVHEVGTTRMGNDPDKSVVNKFCQAHDCKNLYIMDGGPFVSQADKNPTWTILALAWRASDHMLKEIRKRNI